MFTAGIFPQTLFKNDSRVTAVWITLFVWFLGIFTFTVWMKRYPSINKIQLVSIRIIQLFFRKTITETNSNDSFLLCGFYTIFLIHGTNLSKTHLLSVLDCSFLAMNIIYWYNFVKYAYIYSIISHVTGLDRKSASQSS